MVRSGGTDYRSAAQAVTTSYGHKTAIRESDPAPGAPWPKAGVNGAEFGMEVACSGLRRSREPRDPSAARRCPAQALLTGVDHGGHAQNRRIIAPRCRARSPEARWVAQQVLGSPEAGFGPWVWALQ